MSVHRPHTQVSLIWLFIFYIWLQMCVKCCTYRDVHTNVRHSELLVPVTCIQGVSPFSEILRQRMSPGCEDSPQHTRVEANCRPGFGRRCTVLRVCVCRVHVCAVGTEELWFCFTLLSKLYASRGARTQNPGTKSRVLAAVGWAPLPRTSLEGRTITNTVVLVS